MYFIIILLCSFWNPAKTYFTFDSIYSGKCQFPEFEFWDKYQLLSFLQAFNAKWLKGICLRGSDKKC